MPTTYYDWDELEDNIDAEHDEAGNLVAEYTHEPGLHGSLVSEHRGGQTLQHHYDAQGNTLAVTDESGNVVDTFGYTAFGEVTERTGTTETPFRYKGEQGYFTDLETGELIARRRPLSPRRGRWLTVALHGSSNLTYSYAANSPLSFAMPAGDILVPLFFPPGSRKPTAVGSWLLIAPLTSMAGGLSRPLVYAVDCKILKQPTATGDCGGATFECQWQVDEASRKRGGGGAVIQYVDVEYNVRDCCADWIDPAVFNFSLDAWPAYEAWAFDDDPATEDVMEDGFETADFGDKTKGSIKIKGKAGAFLNYKLDDDWIRDFKPPFGALPHRKSKPPNWDEIDPFTIHELSVEWDCCAEPKVKTKVSGKCAIDLAPKPKPKP